MKRYIYNARVHLALESFFRSATGLLIFLLASIELTSEAFGVFAYSQSIIGLLTILFQLGIEQPLLASLVRSNRGRLVISAIIWKFSVLFLLSFIVYFIVDLMGIKNLSDLIFSILLIEVLSPVREWQVASKKTSVLAVSSGVALLVICVITGVLIALDHNFVIEDFLLAIIAARGVHYVLSFRGVTVRERGVKYSLLKRMKEGLLTTKKGIYVIPFSFANSLNINIVSIVLGGQGHTVLVGQYALAQRFVLFSVGFMSSFITPMMVKYYKNSQKIGNNLRLLKTFVREYFWILALSAMVMLVISPVSIMMVSQGDNADIVVAGIILIVWMIANVNRMTMSKLYVFHGNGGVTVIYTMLIVVAMSFLLVVVDVQMVQIIAIQITLLEIVASILISVFFVRKQREMSVER